MEVKKTNGASTRLREERHDATVIDTERKRMDRVKAENRQRWEGGFSPLSSGLVVKLIVLLTSPRTHAPDLETRKALHKGGPMARIKKARSPRRKARRKPAKLTCSQAFLVNHKRAETTRRPERAERSADRARMLTSTSKHAPRRTARQPGHMPAPTSTRAGAVLAFQHQATERKIDHLQQSQAERKRSSSGGRKRTAFRSSGNKVAGGTPRQRLVAGALAAAITARRDTAATFTPGPVRTPSSTASRGNPSATERTAHSSSPASTTRRG